MHLRCFVLVMVGTAVAVSGRSTATSQNSIPGTGRSQDSSSGLYLGDLRFVYKTYQECAATDLSSCLKLKLVTALDRAARSAADVSLFEGVSFVRDPAAKEEPSQPSTEAELEATLPRALDDKEDTLNGLIMDKLFNFFKSHTLQVKLPSSEEIQRSMEEGRKKNKKMGGLMMIPLLLGGTLVPLALGALALLAGKALIVSKLALVLAGIIGLKKLLGGNSAHHESSHEVVVGGGHGGGGWARNFDAQNLAYNAYTPTKA